MEFCHLLVGVIAVSNGTCSHNSRKAGDLERGSEVIKEMKEVGMKLDQVAYSILIDMFGKAGRYEDAAATFRELQVQWWSSEVWCQ